MYKVGDFVFAHIRGFAAWPAVVNKLEIKGKTTSYHVNFFGPKHETGQCTVNKLYHFEENRNKIATGKIMEDKDFLQAMKEIENEIKAKKNKSVYRSPMGRPALNSTPKNSKLRNDFTASSGSSPLIQLNKAVNTTTELDPHFQLEALTDKCIELEKKILECEEKISFYKETETKLQNENEQLKSDNLELENNYLGLLNKQSDQITQEPNFQTQILLQELKNEKLENENLKTASKMLLEQNRILEQKIHELNQSGSNCLNCFPPIQDTNQLRSSLNPSGSSTSWTKISRTHKRTCHVRKSLTSIGLPCANSFAPLAIADEGEEEENLLPEIVICGDSHGRDLAFHLNRKRKSNNAFGFIKPGGCTKDVLTNKNVTLKENDIMVVVCGTNDVARNEANKALEGITQTIHQYSHTNIVLVDLPNRYDLVKWSCVNQEVRKTNMSLKELSQQYQNVTLVEASKAERHFHTRQGLHLNYRGKIWLAERISEQITKLTEPKQHRESTPPPSPCTGQTTKSPEQGLVIRQPPPPGVETTTETDGDFQQRLIHNLSIHQLRRTSDSSMYPATPSTETLAVPSVSLSRLTQQSPCASTPHQVNQSPIVVPGDLTFSEVLKPSSGESNVAGHISDVSLKNDLCSNEQSPVLNLNSRTQQNTPVK